MAAPFGPPVLTPADFATLQNTLGPMGVLTQMEAERVTQAEQLAQRSREAQAAAGQAGQAYQAAASQPPPIVAPTEELLNTLTGGIASVLTGHQGAAQRAQQRTRDTRGALLQARADNLNALREGWKQKADFADRAGDIEASIQARSKYEQLSKTFDQLQQTQNLTARSQEAEADRHAKAAADDKDFERQKALIRLRGQVEKEVAGIRSGTGIEGGAGEWARLVASGQAALTTVPYKLRTQVVQELSNAGSTILPPKVRDTVNSLSAARGVLSTISDLSAQVNTATTGKGRIAQGLKSMARGAAQSTEADALYDDTVNGLLATLSRASGERGVLTDRDVKRAKSLVPNRFDSKPVAERKLKQFAEFLDQMEERTIRVYTTPAASALGGGMSVSGGSAPKAVRYGYDAKGNLVPLKAN